MKSVALGLVGLLCVAGCEHVRASDRENAFQHCRWIEDDDERMACVDQHIADTELDRHNRARAVELEVAAAERRQSICMAYGGSEDSCGDAANRGIHPDRPVDPENPLGKVLLEPEDWKDTRTWDPVWNPDLAPDEATNGARRE